MINFKSRLLLFCMILFPFPLWASIQVMPTRVFLDQKHKSARVAIRNVSKEEKTFKIKPIFYRMFENGRLEAIEKATPEERSAKDLIRYSPKKTTLKPGQEQVVRILARRKKDMAPGEYRIHLHFSEDNSLDQIKKTSPSQPKMELKGQIAVAIPIFYRHGNIEHQVNLKQFTYHVDAKTGPRFQLEMSQTGNAFAFGDLFVYYKTPQEAEPKELFYIKGVSSYVAHRQISYPLKEKLGSGGEIKVEFRDSKERSGAVLATLKQNLSL